MSDVLLLLEYASLNGGERSLLADLEHISSTVFRFTALAPSSGPLAEALRKLNIPIEPFETYDPSGKRYSQDELQQRLRQCIESHRPALLHANSLSMSRLCGPVAAALDVPSVGHLRDILKLSKAAIADLNSNSRLLAVSQATGQWYRTQGVNENKLHVLYNGVDLKRFQPRQATGYLHRELNLPNEAKLIGAIGQVGMRKGLDVALQAAGRVFENIPQVHFLIIGQRYSQKDEAVRYEADLQQLAQQQPLAGRVHFLGVRDDIHLLLNELTMLVHAARQEPLGRVLLEAAASAVPVVASDVGGTREIFPPDTESAILFPADNVSALTSKMTAVLGDRNLRHRLASHARARAEAHFAAAESAKALAVHYCELLSAHQNSPRK